MFFFLSFFLTEAINCLNRAIEIYTDMVGNFLVCPVCLHVLVIVLLLPFLYLTLEGTILLAFLFCFSFNGVLIDFVWQHFCFSLHIDSKSIAHFQFSSHNSVTCCAHTLFHVFVSVYSVQMGLCLAYDLDVNV